MHRPARLHRRMLPLFLACLLPSLLGGCTTETTDPLIEAGEDVLEAFDPAAGDEAFAALNRLIAEQASLAAAVATGLADAEDQDTRYAAVYVLGITAEDGAPVEALAGALQDEAGYLRAIAAGALIGLGRAEAIPVLIELLSVTDELPGSEPSAFVDRFVSEALTAYTGEDFGILDASGSAERLEAQGRWRDWWDSVESSIRWDPAARRYVT